MLMEKLEPQPLNYKLDALSIVRAKQLRMQIKKMNTDVWHIKLVLTLNKPNKKF